MDIFDILKSATGSDSFNDSSRLFLVAKGGIVELKRAYKDLTDAGKFEVILFNALTVLRIYRKNHPDKYTSIEEQFYKSIFDQASTYKLNYEPEELREFINNRYKFYAQELSKISDEEGYIPGKIYSTFYLAPLTVNPEPYFDLSEILKFSMGLQIMRKWVQVNTEKI